MSDKNEQQKSVSDGIGEQATRWERSWMPEKKMKLNKGRWRISCLCIKRKRLRCGMIQRTFKNKEYIQK